MTDISITKLDTPHVASPAARPPYRLPLFFGRALRSSWPLADALVIVGLAVFFGITYHWVVYGQAGPIEAYFHLGIGVAALRLLLRKSFAVRSRRPGSTVRAEFQLWTATLLLVIAFAFLMKVSADYSRGAILLFYVLGFPVLLLWQTTWKRLVREGYSSGALAAHRVLLLGTAEKVEEFLAKHKPSDFGLVVSDIISWPERALEETTAGRVLLRESVRHAIARIRDSGVDEVVVLLPWSSNNTINICADMLMTTPAKVRLGPEAVFDRFLDAPISQLGPAATLNLVRPPLMRAEVWLKRAFDFVAASAVLTLISPLLALFAVLIKLDSPGPVLFRQHRLGFNQRAFQIYKFRTMSVTEDGEAVNQVVKGDSRVTRVGRFLRRWNFDELPQLINVVRGEMSLVGPRPHAVTHDRDFELRVASYARRHNIKPGITGWAQVNGYRGPTDSLDKIAGRVEHDLYYIDNWSFLLDFSVLVRTIVSPKAYRNAL
ncbi:undecaprenyl-phosphate glucose phosphotransferase [Methyloceanibacter caenitepidi]|uniref:Undecaprenyl-phosphate galactosephosphotransferase n=1 Tax=Methyloceanibacter caenitepidi TaxID=1384459 RepID=A0A0A8JYK2_9HYPH|nr:undecaprenyl-phosphate glucose phosphotransferase [Methyloceanibacter caenitepidi]BAQ15685.1 undecaprenyl-phosphate galactosephosphotransferase [Methyloceanibacter caenitepidi]